jgi:hypothetical protein
MLRDASIALDLRSLGLTPHTLRHGGPSLDVFTKALDLEGARSRGRWRLVDSCRRYAKAATLVRQVAKLTAAQKATAEGLRSTVPRAIVKGLYKK